MALGTLTQLIAPGGGGKCEAALNFLAAQPRVKAAWVEKRLTAYPPGLKQHGASLESLLLVEGGEHFVWAFTELLRSQFFQVLIAASPVTEELELRRLQLAAEQSQAAVLLLAAEPQTAWPIRTHLKVHRDIRGGLHVQAWHASMRATTISVGA